MRLSSTFTPYETGLRNLFKIPCNIGLGTTFRSWSSCAVVVVGIKCGSLGVGGWSILVTCSNIHAAAAAVSGYSLFLSRYRYHKAINFYYLEPTSWTSLGSFYT